MTLLSGIVRAVVVRNDDPTRKSRLQVDAPAAWSGGPRWAEACVPSGSPSLPPTGSTVWLMFEGGDAAHPVWLGTRP